MQHLFLSKQQLQHLFLSKSFDTVCVYARALSLSRALSALEARAPSFSLSLCLSPLSLSLSLSLSHTELLDEMEQQQHLFLSKFHLGPQPKYVLLKLLQILLCARGKSAHATHGGKVA